MARRYRYAIIKKKEAAKGKLSVGLAIASLLLFGGAVGIAYVLEDPMGLLWEASACLQRCFPYMDF